MDVTHLFNDPIHLPIALLSAVLAGMVVSFLYRQRSRRVLKDQLRFLQTLINSIPSPVFYKDAQGIYMGCNAAFLTMLGKTEEEVVGKTVYDLSPPELAEVYKKADNDLFAAGGVQRYETQVRFADGSIHEIFFTKSVFLDARGETAGLLGVMIDITERKQAEENLQQAREMLESQVEERTRELREAERESHRKSDFLDTVINSINHGIVVIDAETYEVKLANSAACGGECPQGTHCYEMLHGRVAPCASDVEMCPLLEVKKTGEPTMTRHDHVGSDGNPVSVEIHTYPVFDEQGKVVQVIDIIMDITERRRVELAMMEAKEMAETTNRLMSEFLDTVSHELRTPMTSVHGFTKLIRKSFRKRFAPLAEGDEKLLDSARRINDNLDIVIAESERLADLVSDHLDLSKLQSGRIEWHQEEIVPAELVKRSTAAVASLFESSDLKLELAIEPNLPAITGDPDRLLQVLINLLSNAAKFTDEGTVTCSASATPEGVLLSVTDTGIGISEDVHNDIFNKFKQVSSKQAGKPAGTGLGLAISKEIVQHHGGRIWVESTPGLGSSFRFVIPVA